MDEIRRRPGRPPRVEKKEEGRRRKSGEMDGNNLKLRVEKTPKLAGYQLRWFNDEGTKIHDKTVLDDWDFVTKDDVTVEGRVDVGDATLNSTIDPGERVSIPVEIGGGQTTRAFLCKKRKDWFDADRAKLRQRNERQLQGLHRTIDKETGKIEIN